MSSFDLAIPERVNLSLPIAGIGYRSLAYLIDVAILFAFWAVAYFVASLLISNVLETVQGLTSLARTVGIIGIFATQWVYWTVSETWGGGQTIGKRALGIRVVRWDGSPVTFYETAVRNLCRWLDFLPVLYAAGTLTMLLHPQNRRLGDLIAGTTLIREERVDLSKYQSSQSAAGGSALAASDVELIASYLQRAPQLDPDARGRLARSLFDRFGAHLPAEEKVVQAATLEATEQFLAQRAGVKG